MIRLVQINKSFQNGKQSIQLLRGLDLSVRQGESVAIMGRSGSGKTTLLNILAGLVQFDSGSYTFEGKEVSQADEDARCKMRFEKIGYIMQNNALLYDRNVLKNIALPLQFDIRYDEVRDEYAKKAAQMVGIEDKLTQRPHRLSGGEQQRVAIARALVTGSSVILADEPTGSLDSHTEKEILDIFIRLNNAGKTLIMITHNQSVAQICQTRYVLSEGVLIRGEACD